MKQDLKKKQKVVSLWIEEGISQKESYLRVFPNAMDEDVRFFFNSSKILKYIKNYFGEIDKKEKIDIFDILWKKLWNDTQKIKNETFNEKNWSGANTSMKTLVALFFRRYNCKKKDIVQSDQKMEQWENLLREFENIFNKKKESDKKMNKDHFNL